MYEDGVQQVRLAYAPCATILTLLETASLLGVLISPPIGVEKCANLAEKKLKETEDERESTKAQLEDLSRK